MERNARRGKRRWNGHHIRVEIGESIGVEMNIHDVWRREKHLHLYDISQSWLESGCLGQDLLRRGVTCGCWERSADEPDGWDRMTGFFY